MFLGEFSGFELITHVQLLLVNKQSSVVAGMADDNITCLDTPQNCDGAAVR